MILSQFDTYPNHEAQRLPVITIIAHSFLKEDTRLSTLNYLRLIMSRGYGKLQQSLIRLLEDGTEDGYKFDISALKHCDNSFMGIAHNSIHRAFKRLVDDGVVIQSSEVLEQSMGILPTRCNIYISANRIAAQRDYEQSKLDRIESDKQKAVSLGISYEEYQVKTLLGKSG